MTDLRVIPWIRELTESEAVNLARSLIHAEVGRLGLPITDFEMSGRVKARDQGIDGRTAFPLDSSALLPSSPRVWQVKSGPTPPSAEKEFNEKHTDLHTAIEGGSDYVLFWTNDPADPTRTRIKREFTNKVERIRGDASADVLFADQIEALCYSHLAVLGQFPALSLGGLLGLEVWGRTQGLQVEFQADDKRHEYLEIIRQHVRTEDARTSALHLYGDTGVGKSRLVYEALLAEGIKQRVLVAVDPADLDRNLLALVAQSPQRRLLLVVDDCTSEDRRSITQRADLAQGRIRLITVGSRYSREPQPPDRRYLELPQLGVQASRQIGLTAGLSESDAGLVATYTEGYPKLAFVLATAIAEGGPAAGLLQRIRGEEVGSVLSSMLRDERDVLALGALALFEKLGFEHELAPETTIACEALGLNESEFRIIVDRELTRFVSSAGRYRLVTPRLLAVWLTSEYLRKKPDLARALQELPETMRDRMVSQMGAFAGDGYVASALSQIFDQHPFSSGALEDVDEGSARLIHVAAIVDPVMAMSTIDRLLAGRSTAELESQVRNARRGLVNALEVLLWFEETFDGAAWALLRLAVAENETWSNNSTGILQGIFKVYLGGTSVPYQERLRWAESALERMPEARGIILPGLANAFNLHELRGTTDFGLRSAPDEWRPESAESEVACRRAAWQLLIGLAKSDPTDEAASIVGGVVRPAAQRGLVEEVLGDLTSVRWPVSARAAIGKGIDDLLSYDDPPASLRERLEAVWAELIGTTGADRLRYVFATPTWELHDKESFRELGPLAARVAAELAASDLSDFLLAARDSMEGDPQTVSMIFNEAARLSNSEEPLARLEAEDPFPEAAALGTFVGLASTRTEDWSVEVLTRWMEMGFGRLVISGVHALSASTRLASLAVQAVKSGLAPSIELGRLLYGAWTVPLPASSVAEIAETVAGSNEPRAVEHSLGMLAQWLEKHPDSSDPEVRRVALAQVEASLSVSSPSSTVLALYREKVLRGVKTTPPELLRLVLNMLEHLNTFMNSHDLEIFDSVARALPSETADAFLRFVLGDSDSGFRASVMWLEDAKLLSRLARETSPAVVVAAVKRVAPDRWKELVGHVDFSMAAPDPLVEMLVNESDDDIVRARAAYRLIYPDSGWWGPQSEYLRRRRMIVGDWIRAATVPQLRAWLDDVLKEIDQLVTKAEREEAERDY